MSLNNSEGKVMSGCNVEKRYEAETKKTVEVEKPKRASTCSGMQYSCGKYGSLLNIKP
jgi:hypothetical protein